jgi:hypothetical protein
MPTNMAKIQILTQLCNPTADSKIPRFQGNVIRRGSKVLQDSKIPQFQVFSIARLQIWRVPRFQSSGLVRSCFISNSTKKRHNLNINEHT